jgi:GTP pyrophosphokinase
MNDPKEFMETLKVDLFSNQVFVFTPKGDVIELPAGSTPLDFAFKIHSGVGAKCVGAKVNGKMVPIDYTLKNGEIVDIITSSNSKGPSMDWLKIAKTSNARSKIRQWLKKENRPENVERGRELLERAIKRKGIDPQTVVKPAWIARLSKNLNYSGVEDMYNSICRGGTVLSKAVNALLGIYEEESQAIAKRAEREKEREEAAEARRQREGRRKDRADVAVKGLENLLIRLAKCCNPVRGDDIIGYISKGKGVTVHRADCPNMLSIQEEERGRLIDVEWAGHGGEKDYETDISITAGGRKGLFSDISKVCEDVDVRISAVNTKSAKDGVMGITLTLSVSDSWQIDKILSALKGVDGVEDVHRPNAAV